MELRYGENPHQTAAFYTAAGTGEPSVADGLQDRVHALVGLGAVGPDEDDRLRVSLAFLYELSYEGVEPLAVTVELERPEPVR